MAVDLGNQPRHRRARRLIERLRQAFLGKIDRRLDMGSRAQQNLPPCLVEPTELAVELAQRLAALRRRLGADEIGHRLGFGEIELAVLEGPPRELARLGQAEARLRH